MRKEAVIFVLLLLIPIVYSASMGTVKGYVLNSTNNTVKQANFAITVSNCTGGGCNAAGSTDANGFYIKTNLNVFPGSNISVSASKGTANGINTGIATGSGSVGVATINVTICTPTTAPNLTHVNDTHSTTVSLNWTTFATGSDHDEFKFANESTINPAVSPISKSNLNFTSYTWQVRTCNGFCCTNFTSDTFNVVNNVPPAPNLTDAPHTQSTNPTFSWINFSDPDGDPIHNEFYLATDSDFSTIIINDTNATSPKTATTTTFTFYYWRVRTCDNIGGCSGWSNDTFFVYSCPASSTGTGPGKEIKKYINVTNNCVPSWNCDDWNRCSINGISTRSCFDANGCVGSVPENLQFCTYQPQQSNAIKESELRFPSAVAYLGNLNGLLYGYIPWLLILMIIALIIIIVHQHSYVHREVRVEESLTKYVKEALEKGFTETQIKTRLLESGVDREEIEYVLGKIDRKSKNAVPNKQ